MAFMKSWILGWKSRTFRTLKVRIESSTSSALSSGLTACFGTGPSSTSCSMVRCVPPYHVDSAALSLSPSISSQTFHFPCLNPHNKRYLLSYTECPIESRISFRIKSSKMKMETWLCKVSRGSTQSVTARVAPLALLEQTLVEEPSSECTAVSRTEIDNISLSSPRATTIWITISPWEWFLKLISTLR